MFVLMHILNLHIEYVLIDSHAVWWDKKGAGGSAEVQARGARRLSANPESSRAALR